MYGWIVRPSSRLLAILFVGFSHVQCFADVLVTGADNLSVDVSPIDGALVIDLMGSIWTLPAAGGQARQLTDGLMQASRPRWSPDGKRVLYQVRTSAGGQAWLLDTTSGETQRAIDVPFHVQDASWHPHDAKLLFVSDQHGQGLDVWEMDQPTGLTWRLTNHAGDEVEPTWSANGQHLAYIRIVDDKYSLMLRRLGRPDIEIVASATPLSSPSWRPDGSMLTFLRSEGDQWILEMAILSSPVIIRTLSDTETLFAAPVRWPSRMRMIYSADGKIVTRHFEERKSRPIHFRANINEPVATKPRLVAKREIDVVDPPVGRLVIRGQRLFDGIWSDYRDQMDILVGGGKVLAVEPRRNWDNATILDLGDVTIVPGLIDSWAALPNSVTVTDGAALLAYGVTTLVSPDSAAEQFDAPQWEGEITPGPRLLAARELSIDDIDAATTSDFLVQILTDGVAATDISQFVSTMHDLGTPVIVDSRPTAIRSGADLVLGAHSISGAQLAGEWQSAALAGYPTFLSGLADASTPGILPLLSSRQAVALAQTDPPNRRISTLTGLSGSQANIVAASRPNGLPPGLALHAELLALKSAGLGGEQVLHAAGRNAAQILGLENQIGTITPGSMADLLLISGDPLNRTDDLIRIVAVVRNGRFFSLVSLLERIEQNSIVE